MSSYQIHLLLEALASVHSFKDLADGRAIIDLVRHLGFSPQEAEAIILGALQIKRLRAGNILNRAGETYLQ